MRYAGADNFTGRPVPGYDAPECVLVRQAAEALKAVQAEVKAKGLSLKVYDCYRPAKPWPPSSPGRRRRTIQTQRPSTIRPSPRRSCFRKATSPRSRATRAAPPWTSRWFRSTQIRFNPRPAGMLSAPARRRRRARSRHQHRHGHRLRLLRCEGQHGGPRPQHGAAAKPQELVDAMARHGFKNYDKEWWHFTLENEPYPDTVFDFPIEPRGSSKSQRPHCHSAKAGIQKPTYDWSSSPDRPGHDGK